MDGVQTLAKLKNLSEVYQKLNIIKDAKDITDLIESFEFLFYEHRYLKIYANIVLIVCLIGTLINGVTFMSMTTLMKTDIGYKYLRFFSVTNFLTSLVILLDSSYITVYQIFKNSYAFSCPLLYVKYNVLQYFKTILIGLSRYFLIFFIADRYIQTKAISKHKVWRQSFIFRKGYTLILILMFFISLPIFTIKKHYPIEGSDLCIFIRVNFKVYEMIIETVIFIMPSSVILFISITIGFEIRKFIQKRQRIFPSKVKSRNVLTINFSKNKNGKNCDTANESDKKTHTKVFNLNTSKSWHIFFFSALYITMIFPVAIINLKYGTFRLISEVDSKPSVMFSSFFEILNYTFGIIPYYFVDINFKNQVKKWCAHKKRVFLITCTFFSNIFSIFKKT